MLNNRSTEFIYDYLYGLPTPPKRKREKPMRVICVGPPRSATESLSVALQQLGYTTFHGWDLATEDPAYLQQWTMLARQKWAGVGPSEITAEQFDERMGHVDAVIDTVAWAFARELIEAYPDAKVIMNSRRDLDAWLKSMERTILDDAWRPRFLRILPYFSSDFYWLKQFMFRYCLTGFFRQHDMEYGILNSGKWIYREHEAMIRGLVPKERLLEWGVQDGWEPLCEFLGHSVPDTPFPNTNNPKQFKDRVDTIVKPRLYRAVKRMAGLFVLMPALLVGAYQIRRLKL